MIKIDINKAREIAHDIRREQRAAEFDPLDTIIAKKIPGTDVAAIEAERQAVRDKYNAVQQAIDAADDVESLKALIFTS